MGIEIKINLELDKEWNNLIFYENQQSLFLSKKFLNYHPKDRFNEFNIFIFENNKLFLIIPGVRNDEEIFSHNGSTYGGFIQFFPLSQERYNQIYVELKKFLSNRGIKALSMRISPREFTKNTEYGFFDSLKDVEILYEEEETFVELFNKNFINLRDSGFRRNHIRDIKKIIEIEDKLEHKRSNLNDELHDYYKLLTNNLEKHNVEPTHSREELRFLIENFRKQIWIDLLKFNGKIITGLVTFRMNKDVLHYFYGSTDYTFEPKGILKYAYWKSMINAKKNNFQYINFGVDSKYGEEHNKTLRSFKEGFGGKHTFRKTVKIKC